MLLRAIDAGADGVVLRCARATILSNRLRYDDAEAELKRAAKLRGDDPEVLLQQGILACRRAKWRDAVEPLAHVAKLSPQSVPAHFYLGEALNKLDRLKEALAAYEARRGARAGELARAQGRGNRARPHGPPGRRRGVLPARPRRAGRLGPCRPSSRAAAKPASSPPS